MICMDIVFKCWSVLFGMMGTKTFQGFKPLSNIDGLYRMMSLSKCPLSIVPQIAGLISLEIQCQLYI